MSLTNWNPGVSDSKERDNMSAPRKGFIFMFGGLVLMLSGIVLGAPDWNVPGLCAGFIGFVAWVCGILLINQADKNALKQRRMIH
ncbi:hypothetical protein EXS54_01935 [Patescibacteria group bacterium]|nr:hypothetical protein [Patescibacteria group bacterium]